MNDKSYLLLEDGFLIEGVAIGKRGTTGGEICFNTGMTGYQEIYTDPSYYGQIVVNTAPHIGNYGLLEAEQESEKPHIKGLAVSNLSKTHSRYNATEGIEEYLEKHDVVGIANIDTRMLVRHIRGKGAMNAIISSDLQPDKLKKEIRKVPSMKGLELASMVSTKKSYFVGNSQSRFKVAVLDVGVKKSILKHLVRHNSYCQIFPAKTPFSEMEAWEPNGYIISNGPGDPSTMDYAIKTVKEIINAKKPILGICLGHQLLALACDISIDKMHYGHRGLNHPVKNLITNLCEITSQNHGFTVNRKDVENHKTVETTHTHLNDQTVMGLKIKGKKAFSVQYHPEASPGPHDSYYIFDQFADLMSQ